MKNPIKFAVPAVLGGIAAFVLRRLQTAFGFETDTGLPVKSSPYGLALLLVLAVLAVVFALMVRRLPADREQPPVLFSQRFCSAETFPFFLLIAGLLLIVLSGALDLLAGLTDTSVMQDALSAGSVSGGISTATSSLSPRLSVVQGVLTICAGICLFPVCKLCRREAGLLSGKSVEFQRQFAAGPGDCPGDPAGCDLSCRFRQSVPVCLLCGASGADVSDFEPVSYGLLRV